LAEAMEGDEVYLDRQVVITRSAGSHTRLTASGAIDYYNSDAVAAAVARELRATATGAAGLSDAITGNGDLHLDVSGLEFSDATGIRALVAIAEAAGNGRRLVLQGLPARIRTVITIVGWSDLPNLVIEDDGREER